MMRGGFRRLFTNLYKEVKPVFTGKNWKNNEGKREKI